MGTLKKFKTIEGNEVEVNIDPQLCKKFFGFEPGDRVVLYLSDPGEVIGVARCNCGCADIGLRLWLQMDDKVGIANVLSSRYITRVSSR